MRILFTLSFLLCTLVSIAQNLIVNPSAESATAPTAAGGGWTAVGGASTNCYGGTNWRMPHNQSGFPVAQHGSNFFCCGCTNADREARQDVNVTAYAASIDAGAQIFYFSGWVRVFDQTPADRAEIIVEYRNAANTVVLASYATGQQTNHANWANFTDTRYAPVGTRFVRIRLMADQRNGASVDAYFDDLSLTTVSVLPIELVNFAAQERNGNVMLNWTTMSETNCSHYEVFRTYNGHDFEFVAKTGSAGESRVLMNYSAIDYQWNGKDAAYMLIQHDMDGKAASYGPTVVKGLNVPKAVNVYYDDQMLPVVEIWNDVTSLMVVDLSGRVVKSFSGINQGEQIKLHLPSGMYLITSTSVDQDTQAIKILIP